MIVRMWRGITRPEDAERYVEYIKETGVKAYLETPGNLSASILVNTHEDRTEIITLTFWESWDAIKAFAGENPSQAVYYPEDDAVLIEKPERVEHYTVPFTTLDGSTAVE